MTNSPRALPLFALVFAALTVAPAMAAVSRSPVSIGPVHPAISGAQPDTAKVQHVVFIIQENRSTDNLFNGFCVNATICANTVTQDPVSGAQLQPESLAAPFDPFHDRSQFVVEYDGGKMDGFPRASIDCHGKGSVKPRTCPYTVFSYVPPSELGIYWNLASEDGVFSDMNFQTDQTGSFPSHLYAIGAQSGGYYDPNHYAIDSGSGSCGAEKTVDTINMTLPYPGKAGAQTVSCSDFQTVLDLAAKKSLTWRYYSNVKAGFFSAPQAIQHLYNSPNFITPSSRFLNDVAGGTLANITYVIPTSYEDSDHPGTVVHAEDGPNWVASVVNAIGETPFWNTTTIVIWWDDWGGFFDHVAPPRPDGEPTWMGKPDPFEYSFRVPMIIVSPFAKVGTIDHTTRSFVSAIKFAEKVFALGGLGAEDKYEPGLDNALNFKLKPRPYVPVGGSAALPFAHLNDPPAQDKAIPPGVEQAEGG